MRLILASASPRRAELLRAAGYAFEVVAADVDEAIRPGEAPSAYVRRLAAEKSAAAQSRVARGGGPALRQAQGTPSSSRGERAALQPIILGADTTVVVNGDILGKPRDDDEAAAMLRRLSGTRHTVMTGVSVRQGPHELGCVESTTVCFRALSADEVAWYIASGEGRDKAGAYAIQGLASRFATRIEGSYSNVVGLPVATVAELMTSILASNV